MPTETINTFPKKVPLQARRPDLVVSLAVTNKIGHIIKQGDIIGKITATGLYRRRSRTVAAGTGFSNASPVGKVTDASVFVAGDVLEDGAGNAIGTIAAGGINTQANPNEVTLTGNAANNVAAGVAVMATDGSEVAQGISDHETDGTKDTPISAIIGGYLDEAKLRGLDSSAKAELAGASVAGGVFKF
jgi:hypothetical protein